MSNAVSRGVENFGANVRFSPRVFLAPRNEDELLNQLDEYRGRSIRAIGSLHSWSQAAVAEDVLVDLRHFQEVHVSDDEQGKVARIGAGCQIKTVLERLDAQGLTLPAVGLISEQTIAGAVGTATHGSGRNSVSHYVTALRIARYDSATGRATIHEVRDGDELRAARCSLGTLGIVVAIELRPRPQYRVAEWLDHHTTLASVLAAEANEPLQQFFLLPWTWDYLGQHRRETDEPRGEWAWLYRIYWFVVVDISLHLVLTTLVRHFTSWGIAEFYQWIVPLTLIRKWRVVDRSHDMLIMEHELFRHIEVELFVPKSKLAVALDVAQATIRVFAGDVDGVAWDTRRTLETAELWDELETNRAIYRHHYPVCVRKVLSDDALIAMSAGDDEPYYALSFISYHRPDDRAGFEKFARYLCLVLGKLCDARPHWGKFHPLDREAVDRLYPEADRFREIRRSADPDGRFLNAWTRELFD